MTKEFLLISNVRERASQVKSILKQDFSKCQKIGEPRFL